MEEENVVVLLGRRERETGGKNEEISNLQYDDDFYT